jgi:hypothetical protein
MTGPKMHRDWSSSESARRSRNLDGQPSASATRLSDAGMKVALKSLPAQMPPSDLRVRLQVVASREAMRQRQLRAGRWAFWATQCREWLNELMSPIAIPTAGGFVSALLLFAVLAPSLAVRGVPASLVDVPTGLYTEASVKSSLPFGYDGQEVIVELTVDQGGRMIDYSLPDSVRTSSPDIRRYIENHLLTMQFTPATAFGQPLAAKMRIWFRSSRIDVRG